MDRSFLRRFHANSIFHRIRIQPDISQREIIERTHFDKSTVSSIVNEFIERGLVERRAKASASGRGRPTEGLVISPASGLLVGVEVEASKLIYVACGLDGTVLAEQVLPFDGRLDDVEIAITTGIDSVVSLTGSGAKVLGIGVSLPGLVANDGKLVHVPVLGWRDVDILGRLSQRCTAPVYVGNDGKAAAMAEHMFGACVDMDNFIYLFSGSGVGGGLFLDGTVYKGAGGLAGELGHVKIVPQGRFCSCGASGCLAAYLTESALIEEISRLGSVRPTSFAQIIELAEAGEPIVLNVLEHAGEVLGSAISSLINIFNPPLVLLGGDLSAAKPYLSGSVDKALRRLAHPAMYGENIVKFAEPGIGGPRLGGIALALNGVTDIAGSHVLP
ncbi:MAG TPA: ROK family transcriptional regulator [Devosia sp.]|uniref:ROK family transcriptional regulator n=1 Tax=Devosia sp. TaxID=1871048 RepID=UPI002F91F69A